MAEWSPNFFGGTDLTAWNSMLAAANDYDTIRLNGGTTYDFSAELGAVVIDVTKPLRFVAHGASLLFGARPQIGIRLGAGGITWQGGRIIGDSTGWANVNTWRTMLGISSAEDLRVEDVQFYEHPIALQVSDTSGVKIVNCNFENTSIVQGGINKNNSAAVKLLGITKSVVESCKMYGHGSGVLIGTGVGISEEISVSNCAIEESGDNGVYISSGEHCRVIGCHVERWNATGIKTDGSYHSVFGNTTKTDLSDKTAIILSGSGVPDGSGWNGYGSTAVGNHMVGDLFRGVYLADRDGGYIRDVLVSNNYIETTSVNPGRLPIVYGSVNQPAVTEYTDNYEVGYP